jgi:Tetracyclin repressor-like, C-terminal domain
VIELGRAYVRWAVDHPDHYRVMFGSETFVTGHPVMADASEQAFDNLLDAISKCQEAGIVAGQDPREIAGPLWSLVHGVAALVIGGELRAVGIHQDPEAMVAGSVERLLG